MPARAMYDNLNRFTVLVPWQARSVNGIQAHTWRACGSLAGADREGAMHECSFQVVSLPGGLQVEARTGFLVLTRLRYLFFRPAAVSC